MRWFLGGRRCRFFVHLAGEEHVELVGLGQLHGVVGVVVVVVCDLGRLSLRGVRWLRGRFASTSGRFRAERAEKRVEGARLLEAYVAISCLFVSRRCSTRCRRFEHIGFATSGGELLSHAAERCHLAGAYELVVAGGGEQRVDVDVVAVAVVVVRGRAVSEAALPLGRLFVVGGGRFFLFAFW